MDCVNLFFSCDDNYIPFLGVTLASLRENCDPGRHYDVRVLHTGLREEYMRRISERFDGPDFKVEFLDISSTVEDFSRQLHTRDYYSKTTYYRLFIPELFPELDKALYLDSDLVFCGDVTEFYDTPLGDNLVGAVPDGFVNSTAELRLYASNRLGVDCSRYFNAGVLLMNLKAMREFRFQQVFLQLLGAVTFQVAQDQDYLNVICRDRVTYLSYDWNAMPAGVPVESPKLIHFNLDSKPWHTDGVTYEDRFWRYAELSGFRQEIQAGKASYSEEDRQRSAEQTVNLIALSHRQALDHRENARIRGEIARVVGQ